MLYRATKKMSIDEFKIFMNETFGPKRFQKHYFNDAKYHMKLDDFGGWIGFLEGDKETEISIVITKNAAGYTWSKLEYLRTFGFVVKEEKES